MAIGERRYHDKHPFHRRLVAGELSEPQVRSWVENRYYYQKQIPVKDAAVLANLPTPSHRRAWISRIYDHDGTDDGSNGGTASWLALARAVGLSQQDVLGEQSVAPGTRFAVDAYVNVARSRPWLEAVASSLTELFGPPVSVSDGASDSIPLRLSKRLLMQPVCGSIFTRMNSFSSVSAEAFSRECTGGAVLAPRTK